MACHLAIIWTSAGILLIGLLGTNVSEIFSRIQAFFIQENASENVVCEMASILSRPQLVKLTPTHIKKLTSRDNTKFHNFDFMVWLKPNQMKLMV